MPPLELLGSALDAILGNKLRALLTTLGVIIGVLSVILLVSLGDGMRAYLGESFAGMGSNLLQVTPGRRDAKGLTNVPISTARKLTREDERVLRQRLTSLDGVCGVLNGGGTVSYAGRRRDTYVVGVSEDFVKIRQTRVGTGRFLRAEDLESRRRFAVLGHRVVVELFGEESPVGKPLKIAGSEFHVIGTMAQRGTSLGFDLDDQVFIPTTTAVDLFSAEGLSSILMRARDRASVAPAIEEITDLLRRRHGNQVDFTIVAQDDLLSTVDRILDTMSAVLLCIASVALLVGGIGIANIMLVSVHERTREIGVRRSVGARRRDILWQFLCEAVLISLLGGLIGLLLGAGIIEIGRWLVPGLPVQLTLGTVATALGFSIAVGILAGVLPARRGANLDPVEALRQE